MAPIGLPVSVDDLYPKIPEIVGADRYPETGDSEVIFVVCSPVSEQLFTRSYHARELIRPDVSTRLPDLRAQVFFAEARKLLVYVEEVERHQRGDSAFGGTPRAEEEQEPCGYRGYRRAVARTDMRPAHRAWDGAVDEHTSEVETLCRETPILADCPGFWPLWPASRILVAGDVVQVFEDAKVRGTTHMTFRLSFAPWGPLTEPDLADNRKDNMPSDRPGALPRSFSLPSINLARMQASSPASARPAMGQRSASSPARLGSGLGLAGARADASEGTKKTVCTPASSSLSRSLTVSGSTASSASPLLRRALAVRRPLGRRQVMKTTSVVVVSNNKTV